MDQAEINSMKSYFPKRDLARIVDTYEHTLHPILDELGVSPKNFVEDIEHRVHMEWMIANKPSYEDSYLNYKGEPLIKFLDDETHFAIQRAGYAWTDGKFTGLTKERYIEEYYRFRDRVIDALVHYAIEFFSHPKKYKDDGKNLRINLREWIELVKPAENKISSKVQ